MLNGWRYRIVSLSGSVVLIIIAFMIANHPISQTLFTTHIPLFSRLEPTVLTGERFKAALLSCILIIVASLIHLYKPRPRRILNILSLSQRRVIIAGLALATLGYFEWSYRLPRQTLVIIIGILSIGLPLWFVSIRRSPDVNPSRVLIIGDDLRRIQEVTDEVILPFVGYLCPPNVRNTDGSSVIDVPVSDGGTVLAGLSRLGGMSRLENTLVEEDIDTVVFAFAEADRGEFFGALDTCYEHGVQAKVHRAHAEMVLVEGDNIGPLVDVAIKPWDVQDYILKRSFDILFAASALVVLSPIIFLIIVAIKLEGAGPVFFSQQRTYLFGETFTVRKFRTLKPDPDNEVGTTIDEDRYTLLGQILRTTHLDEIPQLWSILTGEMSVVGPRPAQTAIEDEFEAEAPEWRRRWFVKPGLTGLAQINNATSQEPDEKIVYDLQYIRNQSLVYDLRIVTRQIWAVLRDVWSLIRK